VLCSTDQNHNAKYLSESVLLFPGALAAGSGHFIGTAKKLQEEGIDPRARLNAFPMAVSALMLCLSLAKAPCAKSRKALLLKSKYYI